MHNIVIQQIADDVPIPKKTLLRRFAKKTLSRKVDAAEITIRIINVDEMAALNLTYRHKKGPTNILSFPFQLPNGVETDPPILGDIVICAEIVNREAKEQNKTKEAHWAHMVVHGILHLLGYDHLFPKDARVMEALEIEILKQLGYKNPYESGEKIESYD